eukprot:26424_1
MQCNTDKGLLGSLDGEHILKNLTASSKNWMLRGTDGNIFWFKALHFVVNVNKQAEILRKVRMGVHELYTNMKTDIFSMRHAITLLFDSNQSVNILTFLQSAEQALGKHDSDLTVVLANIQQTIRNAVADIKHYALQQGLNNLN